MNLLDYSMIVATRPDPTVLPPSRYLNSVFCGIFYAFYCGKQQKIAIFVWRIFICLISWHRFGTTHSKIFLITSIPFITWFNLSFNSSFPWALTVKSSIKSFPNKFLYWESALRKQSSVLYRWYLIKSRRIFVHLQGEFSTA